MGHSALIPLSSASPIEPLRVSPVPASIGAKEGFSSLTRFQADERAIREKYAAARLKFAADEQRDLDEATRKFWNGEYRA